MILHLAHPTAITVGRLGRFDFGPGWYVYAGSARGPGGLAARLSRHLRLSKPLRWHVDYLRLYARPVAVWYAVGDERRECAWADALLRMSGALNPAPRFGASDCRCPTHLAHFPTPPDLAAFTRAVGDSIFKETFDA